MEESGRILKIMTFNIGSGRDIDEHIDLTETLELLRYGEADVIGLQEVDRHFSKRSLFQDQAILLSESLGMYLAYGPAIDDPATEEGHPNRQYGNAVLSKFPILSVTNHRLRSADPQEEPRCLLEVKIDLDGIPVVVLNTHLALMKGAQQLGVEDILKRTAELEEPHIVVGDFNMTPDDDTMQPLFDRFEPAIDQELHYPTTYSRDKIAGNRLDYILVDHHWKIIRAFIIPTAVSDHFPVAARLGFFTKTT